MSLIYDRKAYAKMQSVNRGEWKVRQWNGVDAFDEVLFMRSVKERNAKMRAIVTERTEML